MRLAALLTVSCLAIAVPVDAHANDPGDCTTPPEPAIGVANLYVSLAAPLLWSESNGHAGLQTHAHACTDENGRDLVIPADTHLL